MVKLIKLFFLLTIVHIPSQGIQLTGKWIGIDKDQNIGVLEFYSNKEVVLTIDDKKFGGDNFSFNNIKTKIFYEVHINDSMKELHIKLIDLTNKKTYKKFIFVVHEYSENEMTLAVNLNDLSSPPDSITEDNCLFFKKR